MFTTPNILSLLRGPLALLFFFCDSTVMRVSALLIAMASDALDGFLARYNGQESRLGTLLDPIMDKFFVLLTLCALISEQALSWPQAMTFLSRDIALLLFAAILLCTGQLRRHNVRAIWCGKISTALQFSLLLVLTLQHNVSSYFYASFVLLGFCSLLELYLIDYRVLVTSSNDKAVI